MRAVDRCADQHDCDAIAMAPVAGSAAASCLGASCGAVCRTLIDTSQTACTEPSLSEGTACKCTVGAGTNDFLCDSKAYPDTICCAPAGWPAEGQTCTCAPLACTSTADGCSCGVTTIAPSSPTCGGGTGGSCCVDHEKCVCRAMPCYADETLVPSCAVAQIRCAMGQVMVSSCSLRSPP